MLDILIGDKVIVIKSPYVSVKNGTVSVVKDIKRGSYGQLFILDNLPNKAFWKQELQKIDEQEEPQQV